MTEFSKTPQLSEERPYRDDSFKERLISFVSFALFGVGGYLVASLSSYIIVAFLLKMSFGEVGLIISNPEQHKNAWQIIMLTQAIAFFGSFMLTPYLYWKWIERRPLSALSPNRQLPFLPLLAVAILVIAFMPFNDIMIRLNRAIVLPDSLHWMKEMEDRLEKLTGVLTNFKSPVELLIGFIVIAVFPAIGEEFVFRGILQNKLLALTRNTHAAIWLAAFIFSAIHIQFLGLIPRMLLGAVFGYLYVWSGNLWVPILAHFVNNGFTLLMVYLYHQKLTDFDVQNEPFESVPLALLSLTIVLSLLIYIKRYYQTSRTGIRT